MRLAAGRLPPGSRHIAPQSPLSLVRERPQAFVPLFFDLAVPTALVGRAIVVEVAVRRGLSCQGAVCRSEVIKKETSIVAGHFSKTVGSGQSQPYRLWNCSGICWNRQELSFIIVEQSAHCLVRMPSIPCLPRVVLITRWLPFVL
jgi:hypothetical protein